MVKTCKWPETKGFYGYLMYHEFFFGPYDTLNDVVDLYDEEKTKDDYFDYDPFMIFEVKDKIPKDIGDAYDLAIPKREWEELLPKQYKLKM